MNVIETQFPGVVIIEPRIFRDDRGYFLETWSAAKYGPAGLPTEFAQDNLSCSSPRVLRGLHYQFPIAQGKLVERGERRGLRRGGRHPRRLADVRQVGRGDALAPRTAGSSTSPKGSPTASWSLGDEPALFSYKCTQGYDPGGQCSILWNDPDLAIDWPGASPLLSPKDAEAPRLRDVPESRLPRYQSGSST